MKNIKNKNLKIKTKKSIKNTLEISILATMSAGKSTVLNALMNKEILPSESKACTAVIFKIFNCDNSYYRAEIIGSSNVIRSYHETNKRNLLNKLRKVNNSDYIEKNDIDEVRIYGKIPFIANADDNLILVDTPGPNNVNNKDHGLITHRMINESDKDLVLYIMDGTTISSNDSNNFLSEISENMISRGQRPRDRVIFVVNKLDNLKDGENIDDILIEVKKLLSSNKIKEPNIYPISGLAALKLRTLVSDYDGNIDYRKLINDKKFEELAMIDKFNQNIHLEDYGSLTGIGQKNIQKELESAKRNGDKITEAIIHTGIRSLEEGINQKINEYINILK